MAVDTRDKRMSLVALGRQGGVLPNPDGSNAEDAGERGQLALLYSGLFSAPVTSSAVGAAAGSGAALGVGEAYVDPGLGASSPGAGGWLAAPLSIAA